MPDDISSSVNVIAVMFEDDSNAYEALTTLKELEPHPGKARRADGQAASAPEGPGVERLT